MCSPHQIRYEKWGGGEVCSPHQIRYEKGGGGSPLQVQYKKSGGGGQSTSGPIQKVCVGGGGGEGQSISGPMPFFGTQKIHHR